MNNNFKIPTDIEKEAKDYMKDVILMLEDNSLMKDVDNAALTMLARNYSMFIKASKQLEKDGLTVVSKVMEKFGLTAKDRTKIAKLNSGDKELSPLEQFVKNSKEVR